jgi:hypothetical protein
VRAHTHPDTEVDTVLEGTWYVGMGDKFDAAKLKPYPAGSFIVIPAEGYRTSWPRPKEKSSCKSAATAHSEPSFWRSRPDAGQADWTDRLGGTNGGSLG